MLCSTWISAHFFHFVRVTAVVAAAAASAAAAAAVGILPLHLRKIVNAFLSTWAGITLFLTINSLLFQ